MHCRGFEHSIAALRGAVAMVGFFIQRPIFASAIAVIMVLAGSICYFLLPVSQFPDITPPQVVVSAVYPGASAQVVADTVTTPLEQQINGVAGMTYMSSSSSNDGSSTITITFDVGYPLSIAAVDVQNRVAQAASSLPPIVNQAGVTIKKQNPNFVLIVNLTSPDRSVDPVALSNYAYLQIVDPLKRLPGVGDVQIFGERRYSMRIWLDPDKLAKSRHHRGRRAECRRRAECAGRRGQDRPVAGTRGYALRAAGECGWPAERSCPVRRHRGACECGRRIGRAAPRYRPHRARSAPIRLHRILRRRPDGGAGDLPDAGLECARSAAERQGQDAGTVEALSQGHRLRHALRHDALRLRGHARRRHHAWHRR